MKRIFILLIITILLTGCGSKLPKMDDNAEGFKMGVMESETNEDGYLTIEYNGRIYVPYGTNRKTLKKEYLDKCIGYVIMDETSSSIVDPNNKDTRLFTLTDDKDNNFLLEYYVKTTYMNQPFFFRAIDTKDKDIKIPDYILDLEYGYWEE